MTRKTIPLAGVIGQPIAHSLSPRLHGYWLRQHRVAGHYVPLEVSHRDFEQVLRTLPKMGFVGVNVTLPHKEAALKLADSVSDIAAIIGAANTLTFRKSGRIHADNTDGEGFMANLRTAVPGWKPDTQTVLVLGAGGASRAVVATLVRARTPRILLANRTRARAEDLAEEFGRRVQVVDWHAVPEAIGEADTIVNTTSLGMVGKPEMKLDLTRLRAGQVVNDLVYNPVETRLLAEARRAGAIAVDGLGMLIHQAIPGFEAWFNRRPVPDEGLRAHLLEALA
ncbi:MAG: shikimate dehydrogenase [Alphaproteobacteria bacterium]|nr:MAG: shikimate dehydrogenase [Alphaproteobacteria bacterium]